MTTRRVRRAALVALTALMLVGCVRHADLRDAPEGGIDTAPRFDAGTLPPVDAALAGDGGCGARPVGECIGNNDFPCAFENWVDRVTEQCVLESGCTAVGWLEVTMASDGCVDGLAMETAHDPLVRCLERELSAVRCPCGEGKKQVFLGLAPRPGCLSP